MKYLIVFYTLIFGSCSIAQEPKIVRKVIKHNDITIRWYYYSYLTDNSPDIIEISKHNNTDTILKAVYEIVNVKIDDNKIIIKLFNPQPGLMLTKYIKPQIDGYKIVMDSTGTFEEKRLVPIGIKEE